MSRCTFLPGEVHVEAEMGCTLLDAALAHGVDLPHECGGNCACTTCHVVVERGAEHLTAMEEVEQDRLSTAEGRTASSRLGCQAIVLGGPIVVRIVEVE